MQVEGPEPARLLGIAGGQLQAVYLQRDGVCLELLYYPTAGHQQTETPCPMNKLGFTHLSLRVDNLAALMVTVEQYGGSTLPSTQVTNDAWGSKAVFVTDPDGLRIELLQAPGDPTVLPGVKKS